MINRLRGSLPSRAISRLISWTQGWLAPALLRRRTLGAAFVASVLAIVYWGLIASDRYVSEAHVIIQRTDLAAGQNMDFSSLLGNIASNSAEQLLLRDHLLSVDMLLKLDERLNLRAHYSDWSRDPISRLWFEDAPLENFYRHYLSRVSVELDSYSGVLFIKAQAYDPETAHAIATMLVEEGEAYMNAIAQRLAEAQVAFLEQQVSKLSERAAHARQALLEFQNSKGMVSPQETAQNLVAIVNRLEAQLTELQTRRAAMAAYLMPNSPNLVEIDMQIDAIKKQLATQNARLATPEGTALNKTVEEYQRLQMEAEFTQDVYKTALVALEKGRVEATRTLKKVSVLQHPTMPQYPLEPRRLYNTIVFILVAFLVAGVVHLIAAIIRDHRD